MGRERRGQILPTARQDKKGSMEPGLTCSLQVRRDPGDCVSHFTYLSKPSNSVGCSFGDERIFWVRRNERTDPHSQVKREM